MWGDTATQGRCTAEDDGSGVRAGRQACAAAAIPGVEAWGATTRPLAERLGGVMVIGRRGQLTSNFQHSF